MGADEALGGSCVVGVGAAPGCGRCCVVVPAGGAGCGVVEGGVCCVWFCASAAHGDSNSDKVMSEATSPAHVFKELKSILKSPRSGVVNVARPFKAGSRSSNAPQRRVSDA
jgi:hypothetical protein